MAKFKKGDVVKCVSSNGYRYLTIGAKYEVTDVGRDKYIRLINDEDRAHYYKPDNFESGEGIDFTKPIRTKGGMKVEVVTANGRNGSVLVYLGDSEVPVIYGKDGRPRPSKALDAEAAESFTLENYTLEIQIGEVYLNVYGESKIVVHKSLCSAERNSSPDLKARVKIDLGKIETGRFDI